MSRKAEKYYQLKANGKILKDLVIKGKYLQTYYVINWFDKDFIGSTRANEKTNKMLS